MPETPVITQNGNALTSSSAAGNQWYNENGIISGATGQTYAPNVTGDYYVIVTGEFGCISDPSNTFHFIYTGLIELSDNQKVNIYPNPFTGEFTLDYSLNTLSKVRITIFNTFGQQVAFFEDKTSGSAGNHRITFNAESLEAGIYYCRIETSEYSIVRRIVRSN
jgi:hypothetical protein